MYYIKSALVLMAPILFAFATIYLPIRLAHRRGINVQLKAGIAVVVASNLAFIVMDLILLPGLFGGLDTFLELWIFVFLPASIVFGLMTIRLVAHDQYGF